MAGNVPRSLARESKLLAEQVRTSGEDDCPSAAPKGRTQQRASADLPCPEFAASEQGLFYDAGPHGGGNRSGNV
jgi:hypothetical protein